MTKYTFYVEGLGREFDIFAANYREACNKLWDMLSDDEKDNVIQFECIDID